MVYTEKVALVTGGGSGIGRATAEIFAERGGAVVVADINEAGAKATVEKIAAKALRAEAVRCDVTCWTDVQAGVETARRVFGQLDVVINCVGILTEEPSDRDNGRRLECSPSGQPHWGL